MKKKIAVLTSGWAVDYVLNVIEGMKQVCEANNADVFIFTCYKFIEPSGASNTTSFAVFDLIDFNDFDGFVITPGLFNDDQMVQKYAAKILETKKPAVSVGQRMDGFHYVGSDIKDAVQEIVLHVIKEHGATRFAYFGGPEGDLGSDTNYQYYRSTLSVAGFNPESAEVFVGYTDWTFNSAYEQAGKLFSSNVNVPNAIVCANYLIAMAATKAAVEKGYSVPDDIIIITLEDSDIATKVIPSLTAITVNPQQIGAAAIELILKNPVELSAHIIPSSIIKRQSCGCKRRISPEQKIYSQGFVKELDREQRFASQLRFLEENFLQSCSVPQLCDDLQQYYQKRHAFEGPDFTIFLDKDVFDNINETLADNNTHTSYGKIMQSITNIQNGIAVEQQVIETKQLIAPNMQSDKGTLYLLLPIFVQKYVYGYYVSKNYTGLLLSKAAYNWTRNIGTSIEKYRQTSVYRRMSEQLQVLSTQDALSGLLNRAGLHSYGTEMFNSNNENQNKTELIFVDINDMKHINDRYGHLQGDLAIKTVAEAIVSSVPEDYIAVRYGGDEFLIIGTPKENADYCYRIENELRDKAIQMALPYPLTVSFGEKIFVPQEMDFLADAINVVDKIMYQNKAEYHKKNG